MTDIATTIVGFVLGQLGPLVYDEVKLAWGAKHDLKELNQKLATIKEVLLDAEQRQDKEELLKHWLRKLKDFCYDAEDILDEFESNERHRHAPDSGHMKKKVRKLCIWLENITRSFKMGHNIKGLRARLDAIDKEKNQFNLSKTPQIKSIVQRRESHSFVSVPSVFGRNKDRDNIIELLKGSDDGGNTNLSVIPIVGIGGIGKTTLAKMVYMDQRVDKIFNQKGWISMQVDFDVKRIIKDIIESITTDTKCSDWSMENLQNHLRSTLENRKCFFVFDNVWEVEREKWLELRELLGGVACGSKILVTSRNRFVASIMGKTQEYELKPLSNEDALALFRKCAFTEGQQTDYPDLMEIGDNIVKKCGGNPLAVKTLGSLLYSKTDEHDWESVRDSEIWKLKTNILPSLGISYDLMPPYLKPCFAYCSIFPKNYEFNNLELIQLWIANGFITSPSGDSRELEEIGQQYWEELWSRSFFEDVVEDYLFLTFKMHGLVHELAQSVAQDESSVVNVGTQDVYEKIRHLSFSNPTMLSEEFPKSLDKLTGVRTIIFPIKQEGPAGESFLDTCVSKYKHLRVLYLHDSSFQELPDSICNLKHLRFLHLCGNRKIRKLPSSIFDLQNLQSLGLAECEELEELPLDLQRMANLRFLDITTRQRSLAESGIGGLTSLRCLVIGECPNLEELFESIDSLKLLRKLFIGRCPELKYLPHGIKRLKAMENLWICNCENLKLPETEEHDTDLPLKLRCLVLVGLPQMSALPEWLACSAKTLRSISIENCPNLRTLPGWLSACSSLRKLKIEDCPQIRALPAGMSNVPLVELKIDNCERLSSRCKYISGEDWNKIAHIREIYIDGRKMTKAVN